MHTSLCWWYNSVSVAIDCHWCQPAWWVYPDWWLYLMTTTVICSLLDGDPCSGHSLMWWSPDDGDALILPYVFRDALMMPCLMQLGDDVALITWWRWHALTWWVLDPLMMVMVDPCWSPCTWWWPWGHVRDDISCWWWRDIFMCLMWCWWAYEPWWVSAMEMTWWSCLWWGILYPFIHLPLR